MTVPQANLNGSAHYSAGAASVRVASWGSLTEDPLERVLELGRGRAMQAMVVALIAAVTLHGMAAVRTAYIHAEMISWTLRLAPVIDGHFVQTVDIETDKPAPSPPPPVPEEKKDDEPIVKRDEPKEAPAAAAQAGQVLAQNPDNEVLNFSDVYTVGSNDRYAGGDTTSNGTNQNAVHARHVVDNGNGSGQGTAQTQIAAADLSRTAHLAGSGEWRCPFPPEADADQVDDAEAVIEVTVGADGKASRAGVLTDPGHGFGREARACAMREAYVPALDREGRAVASTKRFRVKFER